MHDRFRRTLDALERIFALTERFFRTEGIDPRHRPAVELAIEEVFTNMVRHQPGRHDIEIALRRIDDGVRVELTDPDGTPFDPTQVPEFDPNAPLAKRREGGMGIHLVRRMVDTVDFEHSGGRSTVTLIKKTE